jgi:formate dehydrogenase alpha subunit
MTNSFSDFHKAKMILAIGTNMTEAHPVAATFVKDAVLGGAQLIVVDPRRSGLAEFANLHVPIRVGSDVAFLNGVMHVLIQEDLYDRNYVESCTVGFEDLKSRVMAYPPERAAEISGIGAETIREVARRMAATRPAMLMYTLGITEHTCGVGNVLSCANLQMLLGNVGFECGGVNPLRGQNNVQGACDMGALPNVFPAYQQVASEEARAAFTKAWGGAVSLSAKPGLTVVEMMNAAHEGKIKGLYIMGENPMLSDPDLSHVKESLKQLDILVVQDIFLTETARLADVVLPSACFAEKDGTFTNTERRVQRVRKAVEAPGLARSDWEIIADLSGRMGYPMNYASAEEIMNEIRRVTPSYGGITYERIEKEGLQWPCPNASHPGTKFLHRDRFSRGQGLFHAIEYIPPAELPDDAYPMILTTGRVLYHYHTGTMTRMARGPSERCPESLVEINPADARRLEIEEGQFVKVTSRRGTVSAKARLTERSAKGTIFMNFHFHEAAVNLLTNPALDPIGKIPEYKVCAVKVEAA